jgi:glycosyltransferase involved in cell wall biosynthesis
LHVLIVGEGPQRAELEAWVRREQLSEQVHWPGWQSTVAAIMRAADAFILSSEWEGMPNVVLEAMASGLPIAATDVAGVSEILPEAHRHQLIKPNDAMSLRARIAQMLADPDGALREARELQLHVKEHFTWEKSARIWSDFATRLQKS